MEIHHNTRNNHRSHGANDPCHCDRLGKDFTAASSFFSGFQDPNRPLTAAYYDVKQAKKRLQKALYAMTTLENQI